MKTLSISFLLLMSFRLIAAETDHYTNRYKELPEMLEIINSKANFYLEEALTKTEGCDEENLYDVLKTYFANHSKGKMLIDLLLSEPIESNSIPLRKSVYGDWKIWDGFLLGSNKYENSPLALAPIMKVGELRVGTDKLEHMFGMGFIYFNSHYLKGKKLVNVLKNGIMREKIFLGGNAFATGVFSYGDLSGNFNGMRFWNHMLQKRDDVLGKEYNIGPYVKCDAGKWVTVRKIDFSKYLDHSMDESINCSKFANRDGLKKFQTAIKNLDPSYTCPMNVELRDQMITKYKEISHWIINEDTNGVVSKFNEF